MKRICINLLIISCFFIASTKAFASCSNEEKVQYSKEAANVKVSYEIIKEEYVDPDNNVTDMGNTYTEYRDNFKVTASNLTDNIYVILKNDYNDKVATFTSKGITSVDFYEHNKVINVTYEVYTGNSTACPGEKLITNYLVIPVFNKYSTTQACMNNKSDPFCAEYVTKDVTQADYDNYINKVTKNAKKKVEEKKKEEEKNKNKKKYYIYISAGAAVVIIAGTAFVIIKKRKGRVL